MEENVIGLYQQEVNILSQEGFAVAKQQEHKNQSHFFKKGVVFAVSSLSAILYDPQPAYSQHLKAKKTKGFYICRRQILQNSINMIVSTESQDKTNWIVFL